MRWHRVWLIVAAACGGTTTKPAAVRPATTKTQPQKPTVCSVPDVSDVPADATVYGGVCEERTGEWQEGVTVIVSSPNLSEAANTMTMTNGRGVFALVVPPGDAVVNFYYGTCMVGKAVYVEAGHMPPITQSIRHDCSR